MLLLPCTLPGGNKKIGSRSKDQGPKYIKTNVCYRAALPTQNTDCCGAVVANDSQPFLYLLLSLKQNLAIFRSSHSSHLPSFKTSHRNFIIFPWIFTKWFVCLCTIYGGLSITNLDGKTKPQLQKPKPQKGVTARPRRC